MTIRSIRPDDKSFMQEEMKHLSDTSRYFRFLTVKKELSSEELVYFTEVDFDKHVALVASIKDDETLIPAGIGRYIRSPDSNDAEVAFEVEDEFQGLGIGTLLLQHLTLIAKEAGVTEFFALVLSENRKMLEVFKHCGLKMTSSSGPDGLTDVRLQLG
ncbi:MAG: GNAT family N-acetyltransferase [Cyanobacteria bacterium]|nr:GNAT family N-acetyltransferase [Cyanobacteriota bacterium]